MAPSNSPGDDSITSEYEGEYNAAGEKEGYGTEKFANGDTYEGQWKGGKIEGRGTYRFANGAVEVGFYKAGKVVGEGVQWTADGHTAWRRREEIAREAIAEANLIERHKWRAFWRERVQEAAELFEGTR